MKLQDNYFVGIYCRLSRDDNNGNLESMSIANQRQVLMDYVAEKGWKLVECYVDDGFSGTNFDRPNFKRMIRDAEGGKIDCIITKDLSRLGRNYVQTGYYTEEYFPEHNIRFIAINDGIDTMKEDNDIAAFHNVLNEFYPKQVSKKVRQVKKKSAEQGKFMGSQAPFGYQKSPQDKHILVIDEEAAVIVRRLFSEFADGNSARMIADKLNVEHVNSPRFYHYEKMGRTNPLTEEKNVWGSATVLQLLRNQVYIGNMVQGKRQVVSFKTKKRRVIDPSDWIVVENTHEAIIERDLWDKVQLRLATNKRVKSYRKERVGLFAGLIKCADCGSPLAFNVKKLKNGEKGIYRCSKYNNNGAKACSNHYVEEDYISEFVLNDIRTYACLATTEKHKLAEKLISAMRNNNIKETSSLKSRIRTIEKRLEEIKSRIKSLYEDKCNGIIPETVFIGLMNDFSTEQTELEEKLLRFKTELNSFQETTAEINDWINLISQYTDIKILTREIVFGLIKSITVSERKKLYDRQLQEITIEYRFISDLLKKEKEDIAG